MVNWDKRFFDAAVYISEWSKDRSTKIGAVIVKNNDIISTGYNGFPSGSNDDKEERHQRPLKYSWTEHSERNAIYSAAKHGKSTNGCTIYVKWFPCSDCARAIIQSGIIRLVCNKPNFEDERWGESFKIAHEMLTECEIKIDYIEELI